MKLNFKKDSGSHLILGVAGGSGSGKTTFARALQKLLGDDLCTILSQDHYYIDQSARFKGDGESVTFDHPDSLDFPLLEKHLGDLKRGVSVDVPVYDFASHQRLSDTCCLVPRPIVVVDGTLILSQNRIRPLLTEAIFIETSETLRLERRVQRDVKERGRQPDGILKQFRNQVKPMHDLFVEPSKAHAQYIISGSEPFEQFLNDWVRRFSC